MAPSTAVLQHASSLPPLSSRALSSARMDASKPAARSASSPAPSGGSASPSSASVLHDEHALLAAYETRPTRPKRSSSERSKEFRAKRKKYEGELQTQVDALRREVTELNMRRNIWQEKLVHMRSNVSGALIKVVREYYLVFQHGLALCGATGRLATNNPKAKYQIDFLTKHMDADVQVNDRVGIPALVEMWRRYTLAHASLFVEVGDVTIFGPDEDAVVLLCTKVHAQLSRSTFEHFFPSSVEQHSALIDKFVGKHVTYDARTYVRFNGDGRISLIDHDVGLVEGLLTAADSLDDVVQIMDHFDCKPLARWTIHDSLDDDGQDADARAEPSVKVESKATVAAAKPRRKRELAVKEESPSDDSDDSESERRKLSMNFLLS